MNEPNLNYIEDLAGDDISFKKKIILIIKEEFPIEKTAYLTSYQSRNYLETAEMVHKLKNKISMLGMEAGYELAQDYEEELKQGSPMKHQAFAEVLERMSHFIKSL